MKNITKTLLLIISAYLLFGHTIVYAEEAKETAKLNDTNIIADFSNSMIEVSNTIVILKDIDPAVASSLASNFANVMKYAGYAGTVLGIVNGSVAFMKMIGVMKDPTEQKLINISDQLDNINDRMTEMDNKLNNITSEMAKMEASIEFHARDQKADYLMGRWKDFNYQYMETGLDKSLVDYQSMIINGVKNWVKNNSVEERSKGEVDNSRIIMLYKKNSSGEYQLQFTSDNEIPKNFSKDDRYIILNKDVLTDNINWNVETYTQDIKSAISGGIYRNLLQKNFSAFETQNYPFLTPAGAPAYIDQGPQLEINKIAEDATQALLYRITSAEVNKDAKFTKNLIQQYTNYTNHLMSSEEGIDAMLKTIFLTHAFEVQTKEDINDFLNRMIVKSGAYGLFVINVLGMSNAATEQEKTNAVEQVNKQIKYLKDAKKNSITGMDSYSYITNTRLALVDAHFNGDARLDVRIGPGNRRAFKGFSTSGLSGLEHGFDFNNDYSVIGDSNFMLVQKTMQSNGLGSDFNTLHNYMPGRSDNHDAIITSYSSPQDMPLDGTITVNFKNISGDYFSNSKGKNKLPSDASNEFVKFKQKITGTTFVPSTGQLQSGRNLLALGAYAEAHDRWFVDETAFFGGPSDYSDYYERLDQTATLTETVPPEEAVEGDANTTVYAFNYHIDATYNVIFSIQMPEEEKPANNLLGTSDDTEESYNPLISYKNMNLISSKKVTKKDNTIRQLLMYVMFVSGLVAVGYGTYLVLKRKKKVK